MTPSPETGAPFFTSPLLQSRGIRHGFFGREGGVSTGSYGSLNCGPGSKDDPAAVQENRRRALAALGAAPQDLYVAWQVHSARAVEAPWDADRPEADAVVGVEPGLVCGVLTADCAPVLLADPVAGVFAASHAGWRGALDGVLEATVSLMAARGAEAARIVAAIGPTIGPDSYEVGPEFEVRFAQEDPGAGRWFRASRPGKFLFDLPGYALNRLSRAGVDQAEWTGLDTLADEARFFSHRGGTLRGHPDNGRLLSVICCERPLGPE